MATRWQPVRQPGHLTDRIVVRLEDLIADGRLQPGQRLPPERELAGLLGVSRPVLREAVRTLEARGRVVVRHGRGVFVTEPPSVVLRQQLLTLELTLNELFAMREVLETPAAGWAATVATPEEVGELAAIFRAEGEARVGPIDFGQLAELDAAFHMRVVEMAKNRFLQQTQGILQEMLASGMRTTLTVEGRAAASAVEHRRILAAIEARDPVAARAAAAQHIQAAHAAARLRLRQEAPGPNGTPSGAAEASVR